MKQRDDWHLTEAVDHEIGRGDPFAAAMRATRMPMVITDPRQKDNPIIFANEAFQTLTGYTRLEVIGKNCRFLQGPETDPEALAVMAAAMAALEPINIDLLNYRKDGSTFWNALYVSPVRGEDGSLHYFVGSQLDVTDRIDAQIRIVAQRAAMEAEVAGRTADLEAALEAKTTLLHEVDHRVKNNLMMIGSLLRLQSRSLPDPHLRETLEQMLQRVDALASVHRRLYQSQDLEKFDVGAFAMSLATDLLGASGRKDIILVTDITPVDISARKAAPVGLILNEIITNALKHAYSDGRPGEISLSVRRHQNIAQIDLRDDGPGFDVDVKPRDSIGRVLVDRLSRQARATTVWDGNAPGTHVSITFPLDS
jgi:PAS domain S-box-containing protein